MGHVCNEDLKKLMDLSVDSLEGVQINILSILVLTHKYYLYW